MGIKFDNVPRRTSEARVIALPYGKFHCRYYDTRSVTYAKALAKHSQPFAAELRHKTLAPEKDREIMIRVFYDVSFQGWEGVTAGGEPVPDTLENVIDFFQQSPDAWFEVVSEAGTLENYKVDEDGAKNSWPVSTTN